MKARVNASISEVPPPVIHDSQGDLTFVEGENHITFKIIRVYYVYNVATSSERAGHAPIGA